MAYRYASFGLAALALAPTALAVPMAQAVEYVTQEATAYVTVTHTGGAPPASTQPAPYGGGHGHGHAHAHPSSYVAAPAPPPSSVPATAPALAEVSAAGASQSAQAPAGYSSQPIQGPPAYTQSVASSAAASSHAQPASSAQATNAAPSYGGSSAKPSSTSTPTTGGGSSGTSGGKMGLAFVKSSPNADAAKQIASSSGGKVGWFYNWEGQSMCGDSSVEYVPMLHSADGDFPGDWKNPPQWAGPQGVGAKHAMFVNEPDQTNADCGSLATLYKGTFTEGAKGAKLGGPAITRGTGPKWLPGFYSACSGCTIDFQPYHHYITPQGGSIDWDGEISEMQKEVAAIQQIAGGKPIWVTEFGIQPGTSSNPDDYSTAIEKLSAAFDKMPSIERYSPFAVANDGNLYSMMPGNDNTRAYLGH